MWLPSITPHSLMTWRVGDFVKAISEVEALTSTS